MAHVPRRARYCVPRRSTRRHAIACPTKTRARPMPKPTDVRAVATTLFYLPIKTRMPLKFGPEITTEVTCARVRMEVSDGRGRTAAGWGETPLSVQWVWPSALSYEARHRVLKQFTERLAAAWARFATSGHPMEVGEAFTRQVLPGQLNALNRERAADGG